MRFGASVCYSSSVVTAPKLQYPTYQDIIDAPKGMTAEIYGGHFHLQPRPAREHNAATAMLFSELKKSYQLGRGGPGGWVFSTETEWHPRGAKRGPTIVPDVAGWRLERGDPRDPSGYTPHIILTPQWVCEVLSPRSTEANDRGAKMLEYAEHGVEHYWLMAADQRRRIEVYELRSGSYELVETHEGDQMARIRPFGEVELELGLFW